MFKNTIKWFVKKFSGTPIQIAILQKVVDRQNGYILVKREGEGHFAVIKCKHPNKRMTSQPNFDYTEYYCGDCDSYFLERE